MKTPRPICNKNELGSLASAILRSQPATVCSRDMRTLCLFLFASLLAVTHCARNLSAIYRFSSQLKGDDYVVHWNFDTDTRNISFAVRVRTTGWIGFGLSPNGQMPNSDVIVGWVDTNGQATIHVSKIMIVQSNMVGSISCNTGPFCSWSIHSSYRL